MSQLLNLFLVIFGVIAVGGGLASWRSHPAMALLLLALGVALVTLAYFSDRRREQRGEERKRVAVQQRIDELTRRPVSSSQTLKVGGSFRNLLAALLLTLLGGGSLYLGITVAPHELIPLLGGVFLLPLGLLLLFRAWPGMGQPVLELTAAGFVTPLNGRIAWRDVSGIALRTIAQRNGGESFVLMFRVPQFARVASHIHWTDRLLARFRIGALARGVVSVGLPSAKEPPAAVHALARQLWKQSTGNDYDWSPLQSDEYNEAMKRAGALTARLGEPGALDAALTHPEQMEQVMAQMDVDMAIIAAEHRRQLKRNRWMLAIFLPLLLLVVTWPWIMRLFAR